jgi:hypothetical protein
MFAAKIGCIFSTAKLRAPAFECTFDISMQLVLSMEVLQTFQKFSSENRDVFLAKHAYCFQLATCGSLELEISR